MTDLIEVDGLNADLEVAEDVVEVVELAEQGPAGPAGGAYPAATQIQAEDSTGTTLLSWTAQRIWQAIAKWWTGVLDDAPADGAIAKAISSNWAFDHAALTDNAHGVGTKIAKVATIVDKSASFNTSSLDDVTDNAKIYNATAALTITLETYTDKPEGFQFGMVATGGIVTIAGTFASKSSYTKIAQGDVGYVVRKASGWHVGGVTS